MFYILYLDVRRSPVRIINDTWIYWIFTYIQCSLQVCISWQNVVYFLVRKRVFLWFLEPLRHFEPCVPHIFVYLTAWSNHDVIHFKTWACHFKGSTETCYTLPMSVTEASKDSLSNILQLTGNSFHLRALTNHSLTCWNMGGCLHETSIHQNWNVPQLCLSLAMLQ